MKLWAGERRKRLRSGHFRGRKLRIDDSGRLLAAKVVEFSDRGFGVEMSSALHAGLSVSFVGAGLQGHAQVVHCEPGHDGWFRVGYAIEQVTFRKLDSFTRTLWHNTVEARDQPGNSLDAGAARPARQTRFPPLGKMFVGAATLILTATGIWRSITRSGQPVTASNVLTSPNEVIPLAPSPMITGVVEDSATQLPIADVTLYYAGEQGRTGSSGEFQFQRQPGQNMVLAKAVGYRQTQLDISQSHGPLRLQPLEVRAIYLSHKNLGKPGRRKHVLNLIRDTGSNAIVVDIKDGRGQLNLPVNHALARDIGALDQLPPLDLTETVATWKAEGIYTIARIALFRDNRLGTARPELALRSPKTKKLIRDVGRVVWTNPSSSLVQDYNMEVAKAAAKAGFDEIQFDFVRYPAAKLILEGVSLAEKRRRVATISGFLRQVTSTLRPYNVYVGATVLGSVCSTTQLGALGQHLEEVAAAVDYVSPLLYPSSFRPAADYPMTPKYSYEVAHQNLEQAVARLGGNSKKLRPWLQNFPASRQEPPSAEAIRAQVRGTRNAQTSGWMLRDPRNRYLNTLEALQAVREGKRAKTQW